MPQGLQAWDANGNIVVDLGDYSTRFVGQVSITIPARQAAAAASVPGLSNLNCFAVIVYSDEYTTAPLFLTECTASMSDGAVWVTSLIGNKSYARTIIVDIYAYSG